MKPEVFRFLSHAAWKGLTEKRGYLADVIIVAIFFLSDNVCYKDKSINFATKFLLQCLTGIHALIV